MRIWISCIVLAFLALPSFAGGRQERPPPCLKPAQNATVYGWTLSRRYRTPDDFRRYPRGIRFSTPGDAEEDAWEHGWKD